MLSRYWISRSTGCYRHAVGRSPRAAKSAKARKSPSENRNIRLVTQVDGVCPRCQASLTYEKAGRANKGFDVAHIYPLNPTEEEKKLLEAEERLSADVNHEDNLIPLCKGCHRKFDTPRTVEDYRELVLLKRQLILRDTEKALWHEYKLEKDLLQVISSLVVSPPQSPLSLTYDARRVIEKTDSSMAALTRQEIRHHVQDYYQYISELFARIDGEQPGSADLIAQQVKTFYVAQKRINTDQERIYRAVSAWILARGAISSRHAADIVTSFFVQHCEVFE